MRHHKIKDTCRFKKDWITTLSNMHNIIVYYSIVNSIGRTYDDVSS